MSVVVADYVSGLTGGFWRQANPAAPTCVPTDDGTGTSVTCAVTGPAGATINVYWRGADHASNTLGGSRSGDGNVAVSGLTAGLLTAFWAVAVVDDLPSLPSLITVLRPTPTPAAPDPDALATDWIEAARAALWAAVDADENFDTDNAAGVMFKGTKVKHEAGRLQPLIIEPSACPVLAMAPMGPLAAPSRPTGNGEERERVATFHVVIAALGPATSGATRVLAEFLDCIQESFDADPCLGLASDYPRDIDFDNVQMDPVPDLKESNLIWRIDLDLTLTFRQGT